MIDMEEKEIKRVRLRLLDLLKSFFIGEPDAEKMSRWRGTFSALARERVNPAFDESVTRIHRFLEKGSLKELQDEYYTLFTDPFGEHQLSTSASFYLDGRSHGKTLVDLRSFLAGMGLVKRKEVIETEDSLVVLLDVMTRLIENEGNMEKGKTEELQAELLHNYLIPLADRFKEACGKNESARFYEACGRFFAGYLELEKGMAGSVVIS